MVGSKEAILEERLRSAEAAIAKLQDRVDAQVRIAVLCLAVPGIIQASPTGLIVKDAGGCICDEERHWLGEAASARVYLVLFLGKMTSLRLHHIVNKTTRRLPRCWTPDRPVRLIPFKNRNVGR